MGALWSLSMALIAVAVAWTMRSDPVIVFVAGYVCAVHAERLWDLLRANGFVRAHLRRHRCAKKLLSGTDKRSGMD